MANEITVSGSLQGAKVWSAKSLNQAAVQLNMAGVNAMQGTMSVPTTAGGTALSLGTVTAPVVALIRNTDGTNAINVMTAVSGQVIQKIRANSFGLFEFADGVTAPAVIAVGSAVLIDYLLFDK